MMIERYRDGRRPSIKRRSRCNRSLFGSRVPRQRREEFSARGARGDRSGVFLTSLFAKK